MLLEYIGFKSQNLVCLGDKMTESTFTYTKNFLSSIRSLASRYRDFLLDPGTLFTVASGVLLIIAIVAYPQNMLSDNNTGEGNWLYLLSALIGSSFIWWSAY
jgi:hypothetical protein